MSSNTVLPDDNSVESIRRAMLANSNSSSGSSSSSSTKTLSSSSTKTFSLTGNSVMAISGDIAILSGSINSNVNCTISDRDKKIKIVCSVSPSSGGPYIITLATGVSGKQSVYIPTINSGDTLLSGILQFDIYVDSTGNVSSDAWEVDGQNSNGYFIKFSDGTMICYRQVSNGSSTSYNLPVTYVSAESMSAILGVNLSTANPFKIQVFSVSSVYIDPCYGVSGGRLFYFIVIGRWK